MIKVELLGRKTGNRMEMTDGNCFSQPKSNTEEDLNYHYQHSSEALLVWYFLCRNVSSLKNRHYGQGAGEFKWDV